MANKKRPAMSLTRRMEHVSFDVHTDQGPARLEVDLAQANQMMAWARGDYQAQTLEILGIEPGQIMAEMDEATRRSFAFHRFNASALAGSVVAARLRVEGQEAQAITLDHQTMAELPESVFANLLILSWELNPQWAPALPAQAEEEEAGPEDGDPEPKKTTGPG